MLDYSKFYLLLLPQCLTFNRTHQAFIFLLRLTINSYISERNLQESEKIMASIL